MPATANVNRISSNNKPVLKMLPIDIKSVFIKVARPLDVFSMRRSLETRMILSAVTLKFSYASHSSLREISENRTTMQSNLFQFTYQ